MSEIQKYQAPERTLEPQNQQQAHDLSSMFAKSGLFPHLKNPGQVYAVIAVGRELGIPMMKALTDIYITNDKLGISASKFGMSSDLMMAICLRHSEICDYFDHVESTNTYAIYKTRRKGRPEQTLKFTIEQARDLGLTNKAQWKSQPANMLRKRAISTLARMIYPDLLSGCYEKDEAEQIQSVDASVPVQIDPPVEVRVRQKINLDPVETEDEIYEIALVTIEKTEGIENLEKLMHHVQQHAKLTERGKEELIGLICAKISEEEEAGNEEVSLHYAT
jgi:hypothetical protein